MTDSQCHRTQSPSLGTTFQDFSAPFSSFDFIDRHFAASLAIRRCFSLARSNQDCKTLTVEKIGEMGLLLDENDDLRNRGCFTATDIYRLGFWDRVSIETTKKVSFEKAIAERNSEILAV